MVACSILLHCSEVADSPLRAQDLNKDEQGSFDLGRYLAALL